jgi:hypothetical protein
MAKRDWGWTVLMACLVALAGLLRDHTVPAVVLSACATASAAVVAGDLWGKTAACIPILAVVFVALVAWQAGIFKGSAPTDVIPFLSPTGIRGTGGIVADPPLRGGVCQHSSFDPSSPVAYECALPGYKEPFDPCFVDDLIRVLVCDMVPWRVAKDTRVISI